MQHQEFDRARSATTLPQAKDANTFFAIKITTIHSEKERWQDLLQLLSVPYGRSFLNPAIPPFPG